MITTAAAETTESSEEPTMFRPTFPTTFPLAMTAPATVKIAMPISARFRLMAPDP